LPGCVGLVVLIADVGETALPDVVLCWFTVLSRRLAFDDGELSPVCLLGLAVSVDHRHHWLACVGVRL